MRCADGTQFIVGFFQYDKRAHLQIDGKAVALNKRIALSGARYSGGGIVLKVGKAGTTIKHGKRPASACSVQSLRKRLEQAGREGNLAVSMPVPTKPPPVLWFAATFRIAVTAIAIAAAPSSAFAQSADLVLCDRLAADPADPDKPADVKGVAEIAPSDVATAIKFCKTASNASRRALYQLGRAYAANRQTPDAIAAWRKAADKGSTSAMVELGVLYGNGAGVAKDEAQARKLFERAAAAGNPRGISNLAALGGGAPPIRCRRARCWRRPATPIAEAQYQLGLMTADGVGGPKDDVAARALFERAAAQDHPGALERMGAFAGADAAATRIDRRQSLLRKGRRARQRGRQGRAEARGMSLRAQGQAREFVTNCFRKSTASFRGARLRANPDPDRAPL